MSKLIFLSLILASTQAFAFPYTKEAVLEKFNSSSTDCDFSPETDRFREDTMQLYNFEFDDIGGPEKYQLFEIGCYYGAYNTVNMMFLASNYLPPTLVHFATPSFDENLKLNGLTTTKTLVNTEWDEKGLNLSFHELIRGMGDCFAAGTYQFDDGHFVLKKYDLDATCDEEINPIEVIKY